MTTLGRTRGRYWQGTLKISLPGYAEARVSAGIVAMRLGNPQAAVSHRTLALFEASASHPAISPCGKYRLVIRTGGDPPNGGCQQFEVAAADKPETTLFTAPERSRTRDRTYFVWDGSDRIWVYSEDVGTFCQERRAEAT